MNRVSFNIRYVGAMLLFAFVWCAQLAVAKDKPTEISVVGLVRDAHTKLAISAAQVSLSDGSGATTTDGKGHFKIKLKSRKALLSVSAYDYNVREYAVQGADSVVINLYPDKFSAHATQIEGLNGLVNSSALTSSIKGISEIGQTRAYSVDELLQTELGGDVRAISRSAVTGVGASLFIRGLNSLNANAQPLFVVDGVIWNNLYDVVSLHDGFFSNPLTNIDLNDIENISVLKDGTSIYGSKAANGVVLIKTKRGSGMATKINLNIEMGSTDVPKTMPVMNAENYKLFVTDIVGTAGLSNNAIEQLPYLNNDQARSTYKLYHNSTDWSKEVYQAALSKSYSINVTGGDEKALYYFSLGYTGSDGVVKSTNLQRYNMRLNGDVNLSKMIKLGLNIGFVRSDRTLLDDGVNVYTSPTWLSAFKSPFLSPNTFTSLGDRTTEYAYTDVFNIGNPGAVINFSNNTNKMNSFNVGLKPVLILSNDLKLSETFDYNLHKTNEDFYRPYLYTTPMPIQEIGFSYNQRMSQVIRNNSIFSDLRLDYSKKLTDLSKLTVFAGSRYLIDYFESNTVNGHNSMSNTSINLVGSFTNLGTSGANNKIKSISNYLNVDYNFDQRYLLNLAISMDGSTRFGNETKSGFSLFGHSWGLFPSVNGGWLVSSEKFMKPLRVINLMKLRAGYGITGNDDIKDYQTQAYFTSIRLKGVANGTILSSLANPTIQWETTARANLGLDLSLFNDRLFLTADVYSSKTKNLLVLKQLQDVTGLENYWSNGGELSNKGVELTANMKMVNLKDFQWELGVNAGHYKNEITALPNGSYTTNVYDGEVLTAVGQPAGVFYGYKTKGVFATEAQAAAANLKVLNQDGTYSKFGAGDVIFEDVPNAEGKTDNIIDKNDRQIIGDPNPIVYGTANSKFTYRNFSLTTLFTYSYGNKVYNYQRSQLESGAGYANQSTAMQSRWVTEGQVTNQPKAVFGDPMGNARFSDRWIEDGSYIRLKTVSLAYNLPLKSSFIEGINIWVSASNLVTFTKYLGVDPEFSSRNAVLFQGVDAGLLPFSKNYTIGVKFNL